MNGFKAHLRENHWASMPTDFLHSETHQHLLDHGFKHGGSYDHPTHTEHYYKHTVPNGPGWDAYMGNENPEAEPDEHPAHLAQGGMKKFGWKRSPMHDVDHEAGGHMITHEAYQHPNGSTAHHTYDYDDDSGEQHHSMILRTPK